jgi:hypothetical protein
MELNKKSISQYTLKGTLIKNYNSINDAHKETKIRHSSEINWERGEGLKVFNQHTFLDGSPYERVDMVGNVFNRLVIFDGNLIHSGHDYFGWDIASSRLFQIFFFD